MYNIHCVKYQVLDVANWSHEKNMFTIYNNIALIKVNLKVWFNVIMLYIHN